MKSAQDTHRGYFHIAAQLFDKLHGEVWEAFKAAQAEENKDVHSRNRKKNNCSAESCFHFIRQHLWGIQPVWDVLLSPAVGITARINSLHRWNTESSNMNMGNEETQQQSVSALWPQLQIICLRLFRHTWRAGEHQNQLIHIINIVNNRLVACFLADWIVVWDADIITAEFCWIQDRLTGGHWQEVSQLHQWTVSACILGRKVSLLSTSCVLSERAFSEVLSRTCWVTMFCCWAGTNWGHTLSTNLSFIYYICLINRYFVHFFRIPV